MLKARKLTEANLTVVKPAYFSAAVTASEK